MNSELEIQQNGVTFLQLLVLFRRGYGGGGDRRKPQETLVQIVGFMTDTELLKAWINTT